MSYLHQFLKASISSRAYASNSVVSRMTWQRMLTQTMFRIGCWDIYNSLMMRHSSWHALSQSPKYLSSSPVLQSKSSLRSPKSV